LPVRIHGPAKSGIASPDLPILLTARRQTMPTTRVPADRTTLPPGIGGHEPGIDFLPSRTSLDHSNRASPRARYTADICACVPAHEIQAAAASYLVGGT
jgi:hypothetical protein